MDNTGLSSLRIEDFSGGMTDFYLGGALNEGQLFDNFVLNEKNDIVTRPGSKLKFEERLSASGTIKNIIDNQNEILIQANKSVLYVDSNGVHEIKGPLQYDVFETEDDSIKANFTYWNKHTLATSDGLTWHPQKIYKNELGEWKVTNLGLPDIMFASCLAMISEINSKFSSHVGSGTTHLSSDIDNEIPYSDITNIDEVVQAIDLLVTKMKSHFSDGVGSPTFHTSTFNTVIEERNPRSISDIHNYLAYLMEIFNQHDADSGIHSMANDYQADLGYKEPTIDAGSGDNNYIFGFQFGQRYQVEDLEFLERSPIYLIEKTDCESPSGGFDISYLPTVVGENLDPTNLSIFYYRTVNNGDVLYLNKEIDRSALSSFTDTMSDDDLQLRPTAYTEGGVLDDERPPPCKYIKTINDITYFGAVKEGLDYRANKLRSSKPGAPYSSPSTFYLEFEDDITGIGAVATYPIVFLKRAIYRVDGFFDSLGRNGMTKRSISQRIGCISHDSIVTTKQGAYFASEDGFYFTDGNSTQKISEDINLTYKALSNKENIKGAFDALRNRIIWTIKNDENADSFNKLFVVFLNYRTQKNGHPIYSWSGGHDPDNFSTSAINYIDGQLLRADYRGYLLYHDDDLLSYVYIDTNKDTSDFFTQTIFYDYISVAFDFGNAQTRKWVSKLNLNADNKTSLSLSIETSNDNSGVWTKLKAIIKKLGADWGSDDVVWNESDLRWNYSPVISEWRWMNAVQNLRCMYKQIRFSNHFTEISNSESFGPVNTSASLKTITLTTIDIDWSSDIVNYYISFDNDDYTKDFKIIDQNENVITVEDSANELTDLTNANWKIRGYQKREVFNLLNYIINYRTISMTQDTYRGSND